MKKLNKLQNIKRRDKFNPALMVFFAAATAVAGYFIIFANAAPAPPTIYMTPAAQTFGVSSTITVQIRENSGTTAVNAVQANFSYPTNLLTLVGIDSTNSAFPTEAEASGSAGQVKLARGITTSLIGDQLIATVTFQPTGNGGSANLAFVTDTALVESTNNQDILGSLSATAGSTFVIDTTPPTVSLTAPSAGTTIALGSSTTISSSASDSQSGVSKVEIYIDGSLKSTLTASPYNYSWDATGLSLGAHTIQAKATDGFSNTGSSTMVTVNIADQGTPTISIVSPTAASFVNGNVMVNASATDNVGVAGVQFKLDGVNLGSEVTASPYVINWNTSGASNGAHSLTAVARDASGNTKTSAAVSVTVDNAAPSVSISSPASGSTVNGTLTINVNSSDNTGGSGVSKVELYVDGVLNSTDATSPYSFSWNSIGKDGAHTLVAKSYDKLTAANIGTSTSVPITVNNADTQAPSTPGNLHVTGTSLSTIGLAWNSSTDNLGVTGYQVKRNGAVLGTTSSLSYTDSALTAGTAYNYTISAVDAAGNVSVAAGPVSGTTVALKPGDLNGDNVVDLIDLSILLTNWASANATCDLNHNGSVDVFDLSILLSHYGK
jgi:chitodextrinase